MRRSLLPLLACVAVACALAGAARAAAPPKLPHPLGSGLNSPKQLSKQPTRGRLFTKLMQQFVAAARKGDLATAQALQRRLWQLSKKNPIRGAGGGPGHRRALLQPAEDACPALANTVEYTDVATWLAASGNATSAASQPLERQAPPPTTATGSLPSIRYFTLEPCAEWGCRASYKLVRQSDGSITCQGPKSSPSAPLAPGVAPPVPLIAADSLVFGYFKPYDYDKFWDTDEDNIIAAAAISNKVSNINQLTSSRGAIGLSSGTTSTTNARAVPNPLLGLRADSETAAKTSGGLTVSRAVGDNAALNVKAQLPALSATGVVDAVLPGVTVSDRDNADNQDDNVVFPTNRPALIGYFGRRLAH